MTILLEVLEEDHQEIIHHRLDNILEDVISQLLKKL